MHSSNPRTKFLTGISNKNRLQKLLLSSNWVNRRYNILSHWLHFSIVLSKSSYIQEYKPNILAVESAQFVSNLKKIIAKHSIDICLKTTLYKRLLSQKQSVQENLINIIFASLNTEIHQILSQYCWFLTALDLIILLVLDTYICF